MFEFMEAFFFLRAHWLPIVVYFSAVILLWVSWVSIRRRNKRLDVAAVARNNRAVSCPHGIVRWKVCKLCAEDFAKTMPHYPAPAGGECIESKVSVEPETGSAVFTMRYVSKKGEEGKPSIAFPLL